MTPERWRALNEIFLAASEFPPSEVDAYLERACGGDGELRAEVHAMLKERARPGLLDGPIIAWGVMAPEDAVFEADQVAAHPKGARPLSRAETATLSGRVSVPIIGGRFRLLRRLGKGGMGEVFEAEDLTLNDRVALKMIRPEIASNPQTVARFKREILLGKRVAHPNVCRIHDLGSARSENGPEILFLTMEFLNGETLAARIRRGPLSPHEALPFIQDMADGLSAAHHAGIIHRDFKSANVIVVDSKHRTRAVITDFGLAREIVEDGQSGALTKAGTIAGTIGYMAPEQLRGENVSVAADIYAFGIVIYEMVCGRRPFAGDSDYAIALQHLNSNPPAPRQFAPDLDPKWESAILRCLNKAPSQRFATAAELKAALLPDAASPATSHPALGTATKRPRQRALRLLAFAALVLLAFSVLIYRAWHPSLLGHQQRVAVLEFENVGGDLQNRAFCEGLMEMLSSELTELEPYQSSLSVVPASDIRKENVTSAREAQRDFGVTLAITGSVQRSIAGVHLTINVVDTRQLKQLRSHSMFIPQADAVSMQQGVITQIAGLLDMQLRPEARRRLAQRDTEVPEAYDFYLQGDGYLLAGRSGTDQAIAEFAHALERDPNYALAHAGLGQAYWNKYVETKNEAWVAKAWAECQRSMQLGPGLPDPHIALALLNSGTGRYPEAIREARLAIQIDPASDRAYAELARALDATGKSSEAEAIIHKAIELRPGYWSNYVRLGIFYGKHGRYKNAENPFQHVIELAPDNPAGYTNLASIYHLEGRDADAERLLKQSIQVRPTTTAYDDLATVYFFERRYADAVPIMEKVVADGNRNYLQWGNLGDAYRWTAGKAQNARRAYERAIALAQNSIRVNPRDAVAFSSMALYHAKLGQTPVALQDIEKALAESPGDKSILFNAAIVYELAGQRPQALRFIRRAVIGGYSLDEIATEPELDKLRQDPEYKVSVTKQ